MSESIIDCQYLQAIPSKIDQNFLKNFMQSTPDDGEYIIKLKELVVRLPYPTLQILDCIRGKSRRHIDSAIKEALQHLLKDVVKNTENQQQKNEFSLQFVNFLANFPLNSLEIDKQTPPFVPPLRSALTESLAMFGQQTLDERLCWSLLSRSEPELMHDVLAHLKQHCWQSCRSDSVVPTKEFVLLHALQRRLHFVPLVSTQIKDFRVIADATLRNNLLILKIANEFSNTSQTLSDIGNISNWLEAFGDASVNSFDMQEIHQYFYFEFKRLCAFIDFLQKFPDRYKTIEVGALLNATSLLELLYANDIDSGFEETLCAIESIYKWQEKIPATKCLRALELETLTYYAALSTVYDVIIYDSNYLNSIEIEQYYYIRKIQQLNTALRHMRNIDVLCSLIEDIFQLVFLRWEHLRTDTTSTRLATNSRSKSTRSSSRSSQSTDMDDAGDTPAATPLRLMAPVIDGARHGFICRGSALHSLFTFLKDFVTKKLHAEDYKLASERIRARFHRIIDIIGEALWKYSVLEKIDESMSRVSGSAQQQQCLTLEADEILLLVRQHVNPMEKNSSDDESRDRCNYTTNSLTRRKAAKKRRRATFSGGTVSTRPVSLNLNRTNVMNSSATAVHDAALDPIVQAKARISLARCIDKSIIPKMMGSPENLAIMALALKNFNDVKYIIKTFNLKNSDLNRELYYVEQQQQVKQKLAIIYANYQQQVEKDTAHNNNQEPRATVEQIKNVAAKGFEVSKIISVIDNFAQAHKIQQSDDLRQQLLKHSNNPQFAFLKQFEERNLNTVIITDLILNLPFNREITSSILMVIKRQQQISAYEIGQDKSSATSQQIKDIGVMSFLENLCECMRVQEQQTLQNLLCDNYYSLKPRTLYAELERERAFQAVFYKVHSEIGRSEDLKSCAPLFQQLHSKCNYYERFSAYMLHLDKLLHLRNRNLEYHSSELLKIDPCDTIGELIFECGMTPLEIEANVSALNLNLVHVIALNICPEIAGKCRRSKRHLKVTDEAHKPETIFNYISNQNSLLAYLLQGIDKSYTFAVDKRINTEYLQELLQLPEVKQLAQLYDGNTGIAALRSDVLNIALVQQLKSKQTQLDILRLQIGKVEPKQNKSKLIDSLIIQLIKEDSKNIHLATNIHDIALRAKLIQDNFTKLATTHLAKELIESTLQHKKASALIPHKLREQLECTLADITIYAKVSEVLQFETWPQAYDFGLKTPNTIFEKLLELHLYKLCYNWCKVVRLMERFSQHKRSFLAALLNAMLELSDDKCTQDVVDFNTYLLQILETFPVEDSVNFLSTHKDKFRSLVLLQYVVDFLAKQRPNDDCYRNYKISLVIFEQLTPGEREQFWKLLKFPLLIIEQLIMNAKFEILTKVLCAVRNSLKLDNSKIHEHAVCPYCFDKRGHIYDIHTKDSSNSPHKISFQLGSDSSSTQNSAFILLNFNLYQNDHVITNECIDLLLRIYATKALDYHISDTSASSERISQITDTQQSLDSLCGVFQMPKVAPTRNNWVRDDEASHCMCCRRAAFTMLIRRHHCRRCGRVVCFACSTHRMRIHELYEDVDVRICNDCNCTLDDVSQRKVMRETSMEKENVLNRRVMTQKSDLFKWKLSGNITHDKLLREEFCYEHAPSVALCLSILAYHLGQQKCVELLLYHCRNLEKLIVPNPEVDYELVAKMMSCLALAAKVRGGPEDVEVILEHSDIILSVVQNGCGSLIPPGPLKNHGLRKLADSLVKAEKWQLALEVHLKFGFPTAGVMAAHGLSCLRVGCYDTAREKFSHCMPKLSNELANSKIYKSIINPSNDTDNSDRGKENDIPQIKRPQRGPPLLQELLKIIEFIPAVKPQPETLHRASIIRNSNTSLASMLSRRKDPYVVLPMHEPALNILTTLANLKRITKGQYSEGNVDHLSSTKQIQRKTRTFDECMHYVLTYGSHTDILQFLMRHHDLCATLRYCLVQNLEADLFIHNIFLVSLRSGQLPELINKMLELDVRLLIWRNILLQTCRFLETQNHLNSLYQLQLLLKDPVRASMTCVKFYSMNCENFQQLHANAQHLHNAHRHLQSELELSQWENINLDPMHNRKNSFGSRRSSTTSNAASFLMQMDARSLNCHINTILEQLDVSKFLAKCERENNYPMVNGFITEKILKEMRIETGKSKLPTLFDTTQDKIQICILILLCGKNIDEGFGLSYRVIQDHKLPPMKVFAATAKILARIQRLPEVEKLLNCITSNNGTNTREIDEILSIAINSATNTHEPEVKTALDTLAKKINCIELRISSHIFIGQLKSAYLLANKYERLSDIRKILRQAELTNQIHVKKLCEKKLNMIAHQPEQL